VGSELLLRPRSDSKAGWELADKKGVTVIRMAKTFQPPSGEIIAVRVSAIQVRPRKQNSSESLKAKLWEVVLPEIVYLPVKNILSNSQI
jgi:hypothetical protein